jgi:hypothetical protein
MRDVSVSGALLPHIYKGPCPSLVSTKSHCNTTTNQSTALPLKMSIDLLLLSKMAEQYKQYGQEKAGQAQQITQVTIYIICTLIFFSMDVFKSLLLLMVLYILFC